MIAQQPSNGLLYHNDPVGSTSELIVPSLILGRVNFRTDSLIQGDAGRVYHNDPVGSTSELLVELEYDGDAYTIMTRQSQLQNERFKAITTPQGIP